MSFDMSEGCEPGYWVSNLNNNGRTRRPGPFRPLKSVLKPATSGNGSSVDKPAKKKRQKVCFEVPYP